jgi:hypothetical protein
VGEHIEKCMKAAKDAMEGNEPEPGEKGDKAMEAQMLELKKSLADLVAKLAATPATGGAHSGNIDPLAKTATGFEELEASSITH